MKTKSKVQFTRSGHIFEKDYLLDLAESQLTDLTDTGVCVFCGNEDYGVDPYAEKIRCESCGRNGVFGVSGLIFHFHA